MKELTERLLLAAEKDDSCTTTKILKTRLVDINECDEIGRTALYLASKGKNYAS
jgi:hypothetical protein